MTGTVKSFVKDKGYGFIDGDDGKTYFVHINDLPQSLKSSIDDGTYLSFNVKATDKGYSAIKCVVIPQEELLYTVPTRCILSKTGSVNGFEVIEKSDWSIIGSSRQSPDAAERDLLRGADIVNANAILYKEYFKTTGSEPGTGSGTYYYTIHNFVGYAAIVGKKSKSGNVSLDEMIGLNARCESISKQYTENYSKSQRNAWITAGVVIFCMLIVNQAYFHNGEHRQFDVIDYIVFAVAAIVGFKIIRYPSDPGWWLQK